MTPKLVENKELEILITTTIATLKKKCGAGEVFKLIKYSWKTGLTRENFNECFCKFISNKSVKHNAIYNRGCWSLLKVELNYDDSNNNGDNISHGNTIVMMILLF